MGLSPSLPPAELARWDSMLSGKWNAYFLLRWMQILVVGIFTKEVVFAGLRWVWVDSALSGKWNTYFLLRRMQILVVGILEQG